MRKKKLSERIGLLCFVVVVFLAMLLLPQASLGAFAAEDPGQTQDSTWEQAAEPSSEISEMPDGSGELDGSEEIVSDVMLRAPAAANAIDGELVVNSSLTILEGGYYLLDGGGKSADVIGANTQILAPYGKNIEIVLQNAAPVQAKWVFVEKGNCVITGPGELRLNNPDVAHFSKYYGVYINGSLTLQNGAKLSGVAANRGVTTADGSITVKGASELTGECTGSAMGSSGVQLYTDFIVQENSKVTGIAPFAGMDTNGINCQSGSSSVLIENSTVVASGITGFYSNSYLAVDGGSLTAKGADGSVYAHGMNLPNKNTGITVKNNGVIDASCGSIGYAGLIVTGSGIKVESGGKITGQGGDFGVRAAGNGNITMDTGSIAGTGTEYGVIGLGDITVNAGSITGTSTQNSVGAYAGVSVGGDLTVNNSAVTGYSYAYSKNNANYYGAVVAKGTIAADNAQITENYRREESFDDTPKTPYEDGKNITDYRTYGWRVSSGSGKVAADADGAGIFATLTGQGTLTAVRTAENKAEYVGLAAGSTHTINIPVVLAATAAPTYTVAYDGNGATTGTVPLDNKDYFAGDAVVVLGNTGGLQKTGFTFGGWSLQNDWTVYKAGGNFTMPQSNVTLYAVWTPAPVSNTPPRPPVSQPPPSSSKPPVASSAPRVDSSSSQTQPSVSAPPASSVPPRTVTSAQQETAEPQPEQSVPHLQLGSSRIPLYGETRGASWALLNLILTVVGLVLAVVFGVKTVFEKRHVEEDEEEKMERKAWAAHQKEAEEPEPPAKSNRLLRVLAVVMGIASLIVFILTENMRLPMVIVDVWTPLMLILFVAQVVLLVAGRKRKREENDGEEEVYQEH